MTSENNKLIELCLEGQKYYLGNIKCEIKQKDDEQILIRTKEWLDRYFNGRELKIEELEIRTNWK